MPGSSDSAVLVLETTNRELFEALTCGWLRPKADGVPGRFVPHLPCAHGGPPPLVGGAGRIRVQLHFEQTLLPNLPVLARTGETWDVVPLTDTSMDTRGCIWWPGALPICALREVRVDSAADAAQLTSLARGFEDIELGAPVRLGLATPEDPDIPGRWPQPRVLPNLTTEATAGALHMALHVLPRMPPWLQLFCATCDDDDGGVGAAASAVGASWLAHTPWGGRRRVPDDGFEGQLWESALIQLRYGGPRTLPEAYADIVDMATLGGWDDAAAGEQFTDRLKALREGRTADVFSGWRERPVETVLNALALRCRPRDFVSYFGDRAGEVAPAVGWAGATLSGLWAGVRGVPAEYRGDRRRQLFVAAQSRRARGDEIDWPSAAAAPLRCEHTGQGGYALRGEGGESFWESGPGPRSHWFEDDCAHEDAVALAQANGWGCVSDSGELDAASFRRSVASEAWSTSTSPTRGRAAYRETWSALNQARSALQASRRGVGRGP